MNKILEIIFAPIAWYYNWRERVKTEKKRRAAWIKKKQAFLKKNAWRF